MPISFSKTAANRTAQVVLYVQIENFCTFAEKFSINFEQRCALLYLPPAI